MVRASTQTAARLVAIVLVVAAADCSDRSQPPDGPRPTEPTTLSSEPAPLRIMPLGDSITQADSQHDSYRRPLWRQLQTAGFAVDFVGSERQHHRGPAPHADFDQDHEGHWGWRADEVLARIGDWASAHRPDVVLIHLGSNDVFRSQSIGSTLDELESIVAVLRGVNPRVTILLAQIIPTDQQEVNRRIRALNDGIEALGQRLATPDSPVRVVDQFTGFDAVAETYDGIHPNADGELKMAAKWLMALEEFLPR